MEVDHYSVLGLPSGEEGAKLTEKDISTAYRKKSLEFHPDKRPDDPNAIEIFLKIKSSYEILKDDKARRLFDDLLRVKREKEIRHSKQDAKRRKMVSDLEDRERAAFAVDPEATARDEEAKIARKLKEEIERIRAMHSNKGTSSESGASKKPPKGEAKTGGFGGGGLDKEKVLKVSWLKIGEDYTAERLKQLFTNFGAVEDVVIKSTKKKGSALVVMDSKEAALAATGTLIGDLSNPLLVIPLQPVMATESQLKDEEIDRVSKLIGTSYQDFEDSVFQKLRMVHLRTAGKERR